MQNKDNTALNKSLHLLRSATTPFGLLASTTDRSNYKRIWARDSSICGLAGLLANDEIVIEGLRKSVESLGKHQAELGQIPSNVQLDEQGQLQSLSFGGLCGRVDTISWWIIALSNYVHFTGEREWGKQFEVAVANGFRLLDAWEFNNKGLVYVPESGDWADEYVTRGYVLSNQLLRVWALQCASAIFGNQEWHAKAQTIKSLIRDNYWLINQEELTGVKLYHEHAHRRTVEEEGPSCYWEAGFAPGGYLRKFDLLANALAILLKIGTADQEQSQLAFAQATSSQMPVSLMPSFWPPIKDTDHEWPQLRANHKYEMRNQPYDFHNGGLWPAFNGFWALALQALGQSEEALALKSAIESAIALDDWGFYECIHAQSGQPSGTKYCTWSAGGYVFADCGEKRNLFFG